MRDLNFFSIYTDKSSTAHRRNRYIRLGLIYILLLGGACFAVFFGQMRTNMEVERINAYLMTEEVQKITAEYDAATARLNAIKEYDTQVMEIIAGYQGMQTLTTKKLGIISASLPRTARMESMQYTNGGMTFVITAPSRQVVAQTRVRLEESGLFESIVLTGVVKDEEGQRFTGSLQGALKVGDVE